MVNVPTIRLGVAVGEGGSVRDRACVDEGVGVRLLVGTTGLTGAGVELEHATKSRGRAETRKMRCFMGTILPFLRALTE